MKVKIHAFPISNVKRTDCHVCANPILGDRYKINCRTGKNEKMAIPPIAVIKAPFGTLISGRWALGTRYRMKLPKEWRSKGITRLD